MQCFTMCQQIHHFQTGALQKNLMVLITEI